MLRTSKFLSASILFATMPLFYFLPTWVSLWCLFLSTLQITDLLKKIPNFAGSLLALIGLTALIATSNSHYSLDFCVALLATMTAVKPIEARTSRDQAVTLCMAYFITLTSLWYSNMLSVAFYSLLSIILTTTSLGYVNNAFTSFSNSAKLSSRILLQSLPFALVLFIAFPRLNGSLWGLNVSGDTASGFSDSLSMGEVSKISKDDSTAFRVEFISRPPIQMYWKGIIFSFFDGKNWRQYGESSLLNQARTGKNPIEYEIVLEPHGKKWLFSLDLPQTAPTGAKQTTDGVLISDRPITERKMYKVTSVSTKSDLITRSSRRINTRIPRRSNPKTQELVMSWKAQGLRGEDIIKEAQKFLTSKDFKYSLEPPLVKGQFIDDFLFRTKQGYCEHFASAFTYMMRVAKLPARIVGGYLGGEVNGNYTIVRQADAHVWSEVWLNKYGWIRVDPTVGVAGANTISKNLTQASQQQRQNQDLFTKYFKVIGLKIDAVNFAWDKWVLGYDREQQENILNSLGLAGKYFTTSSIIFGLLALSLIVGLLASYLFNSAGRKNTLDNIGKNYEKLIKKFTKKGLEKPPGMGPKNYQLELETSFPELKQSIESIMELYIKLRFENAPSEADEITFTKLVDELKVNTKHKHSSISKALRSL